jgi:phosphatidyl-myo-inositol dimannoside synthase
MTTKKSPLVLSLDYPPNDGGISRLSAGLVAALVTAHPEPHVVTFASSGNSGVARPLAPVTEVERRKGVRDWQLFRAIRNHLKLFGRDGPILATLWNPEATLAVLAGARRVSILAHGNEVMPYKRRGVKHWLRRIVLQRAHVVICNSGFTETLVKAIAPKAETAVLNPAVDAAAFSLSMTQEAAREFLDVPAMARIVLTVARLDPIKGHETVLRAIASMPPLKRQALTYVIIGKGEMYTLIKETADQLGITDRVKFAGFVTDQELMTWYAAADLFVLPSIVDCNRRGMEGFGMALTEAQAAGLPVIGTRSGGIPDAVKEGEGGWLIEERDHAALADHLTHLVDAPAEFDDQGRLAAERIRRDHSWQNYAANLLELI